MNVHVPSAREPQHDWTDGELELVKRRLAEGLSYGAIALELGHGLTRNAVIDKAKRMKFDQAQKSPKLAKSKKAAKASRQSASARRQAAVKIPSAHPVDNENLPALRFEPHRPGTRLETDPADGVDVTNLLGLTAHTCRFPVGDVTGEQQLFCGRPPKDGSPYCRDHSERAFNRA